MIKLKYLPCFILLFMTSLVYGQDDSPMPSIPGKCYAKCKSSDVYKKVIHKLPRYTGLLENVESNTNLYPLQCKPQNEGFVWKKMRADRNCLSSNPDDCLVWCKVKAPQVKSIEYFVKDTMLTTTYEMIEIERKELVSVGGNIGWTEVICDGDVKPNLIKKIQKVLKENLYFEGEVDGKVSTEFKQALSSYQKDNGLNYGAITFETMRAMGVKR